MPDLNKESARWFADQFRSARLAALSDGEAFDEIIHVIERLGSYLCREELAKSKDNGSLGSYRARLLVLVQSKGMAEESRPQFRNLITPFETLYNLVKDARNDALHQGAFARHLTKHAIELGIILEEVLSTYMDPVVADFMVRNPVCGEFWQPLAFVRQQMLANSFSYLPVSRHDNQWFIVSDTSIATFLGSDRKASTRTKRLAMTLKEAFSEKPDCLTSAKTVDETTSLEQALDLLVDSHILLVQNPAGTAVLGIVTAFDLL
jgi:predicted transcriptional regulator